MIQCITKDFSGKILNSFVLKKKKISSGELNENCKEPLPKNAMVEKDFIDWLRANWCYLDQLTDEQNYAAYTCYMQNDRQTVRR